MSSMLTCTPVGSRCSVALRLPQAGHGSQVLGVVILVSVTQLPQDLLYGSPVEPHVLELLEGEPRAYSISFWCSLFYPVFVLFASIQIEVRAEGAVIPTIGR